VIASVVAVWRDFIKIIIIRITIRHQAGRLTPGG
jgi:hypothetical protein